MFNVIQFGKGLVLAVAMAMVLFAGAAPAVAAPQSDGDITKGEITRFDQYLDNHPEVAESLRKNPSLVNREDFLEAHPGLRDWMKDHPEAKEELKENPRAFMKDERRFENKGGDITRGEVKNFDQYLDNHPGVHKQLSQNPSLINNEDYLEKHPELREWLKNHPGARQELRENPKAFMRRERGYDKREGQTPTPAVAKSNVARPPAAKPMTAMPRGR